MQRKTYKSCVVLLSGGQDSTTCLYWALANFESVKAVGFNYGQKHVEELNKARKIAEDVGVDYSVFDVRGLLAASSLTEEGDHNAQSKINADLPASFTVGRNILFLSIVGSYAASIGVNDIVTGVCQTD